VGYRKDLPSSVEVYDQLWADGLKAVVDAGGTISHHHGVGVLKAGFMKRQWGESFEWLCNIKKNLDPKNIMNPGKLGFPETWKEES